MKLPALLLVTALAASPAWAHDVEKGPHGGRVVETGDFHVELVARQTNVEVYLTDSKERAMAPAGYKGVAILTVGGKPQRIELKAEPTHLSGTATTALPAQPKGVVQITKPDGKTGQAKF